MKNKRLVGLDCLRGLAALAVLLVHFSERFKTLYPTVPSVGWHIDSSLALNAVQLFFAISGFVIFMTLERIDKPMDFVKARFFRLYPTFWAAVTFTFVILLLFNLPGRGVFFTDYLWNLTMIPRFFSGPEQTIPYVDGVYWTLQAEFFFYVLMFFVLLTRSKQHIDWIITGLLVWSALYRFVPIPSEFISDKLRTITLVDYVQFFALGIFVYRLKLSPEKKWKYLSLLVLTLAVATFRDGREVILPFTIIALLLMFAAQIQNIPAVINPLAYLGTISYSLYLVHQNFGYVILREMGLRGINANVAFAVACVASLIVASALCFGIEKPAMVLSKRFTARKKTVQATA